MLLRLRRQKPRIPNNRIPRQGGTHHSISPLIGLHSSGFRPGLADQYSLGLHICLFGAAKTFSMFYSTSLFLNFWIVPPTGDFGTWTSRANWRFDNPSKCFSRLMFLTAIGVIFSDIVPNFSKQNKLKTTKTENWQVKIVRNTDKGWESVHNSEWPSLYFHCVSLSLTNKAVSNTLIVWNLMKPLEGAPSFCWPTLYSSWQLWAQHFPGQQREVQNTCILGVETTGDNSKTD